MPIVTATTSGPTGPASSLIAANPGARRLLAVEADRDAALVEALRVP